LSGDREAAVTLLQEAATPGAETETDALLLLMIVDNREGRHADALQSLAALQRMHPRNRLLRLNHGAAALAAGRPVDAETVLSEGIAAVEREKAPAVLGESALWFAHRGTARVRLRRDADAVADLQRGLGLEPRDWVNGRIHAQLGELAGRGGDRVLARREFETALALSQRAGDRPAVTDVRQKLRALAN
jgi:tetratricopeptide (TPR) repeat protein